jgi:hypothetical protein
VRVQAARLDGSNSAEQLGDGPEVVMQMAEKRAPNRFDRVEVIFRPGELEEVARRYNQVAGFDLGSLTRHG